MLAYCFLGVIYLYRMTLSPITGLVVQCRFHPTCSQYGMDAIRKYGAFRGGYLTIKRILRCNPFFPGGYDPVK